MNRREALGTMIVLTGGALLPTGVKAESIGTGVGLKEKTLFPADAESLPKASGWHLQDIRTDFEVTADDWASRKTVELWHTATASLQSLCEVMKKSPSKVRIDLLTENGSHWLEYDPLLCEAHAVFDSQRDDILDRAIDTRIIHYRKGLGKAPTFQEDFRQRRLLRARRDHEVTLVRLYACVDGEYL